MKFQASLMFFLLRGKIWSFYYPDKCLNSLFHITFWIYMSNMYILFVCKYLELNEKVQ